MAQIFRKIINNANMENFGKNKHLLTDGAVSTEKYLDLSSDVRRSVRRAKVRMFFSIDQAIG